MALMADYELPDTGIVIPDAYHVVMGVRVEKRLQDVQAPVDNSREDKRTAGWKADENEAMWKSGYIGNITIGVWKNAEERNANARPIGLVGGSTHSNTINALTTTTKDMDSSCTFMVDMESSDNHITQAYTHLKTTKYYKNSTAV